MKKITVLCALLFIAFTSLCNELPFPIGEELRCSISWNRIPVAWAKVITSEKKVDDKEVIVLKMRVRTYAFFNKIYPVDDIYVSWVDPETLLPIRFEKDLKEGKYRCHEVTFFDFEKKEAHYEHQLNKTTKTYKINENTRDLLSFVYYMRMSELKEDDSASFNVMIDEDLYDLTLYTKGIKNKSVCGYKEKVPCIKVIPEGALNGKVMRKGKGKFWISRDPRRLPIFAKVGVPFGKARFKLKEVSGPGDDFWIDAKKD